MNAIKKIVAICRTSRSNTLLTAIKYLYYKSKGRNIIAHHRAVIDGVSNIYTSGILKVGMDFVGFVTNKDYTYLNIRGRLNITGSVSIRKGCRFDVGPNAIVTIRERTYISPFTKVIIMHGLQIGSDCAIAWNCQFLDDDFHEIKYEGKKEINNNIVIRNKVWIGSNVSILKGTVIPDGCVVASNSVVKGIFLEENVLIAGNPAKIIKRGVIW